MRSKPIVILSEEPRVIIGGGKPVPFQCYGKRSEIGVEYACGGIFCPCSLAQGQHCDQGDYNATHKAFFNSDM